MTPSERHYRAARNWFGCALIMGCASLPFWWFHWDVTAWLFVASAAVFLCLMLVELRWAGRDVHKPRCGALEGNHDDCCGCCSGPPQMNKPASNEP